MRGTNYISSTLLLLLLSSPLLSDTASFDDQNRTSISPLETSLRQVDRFQEYWSHRMRLFSSNVDRSIVTFFTDEPGYTVTDESFFLTRWFNDYFVDDTFFDPTNKSYIRILGSYGIGSKSDSISFADIRARVRLPRSKHHLQLFIGDETKTGDELSSVAATEDHSGIGLRYLKDFFSETLKASASVGITRIDNPYVRLRIGRPVVDGQWFVQPTQTFRYSVDKEFEEWTSLLIAYNLTHHGAFQWLMQRSTQSGVPGMEYLSEFAYQEINRHRIGLKPYMVLFGRTKEYASYENGVRAQEGIYNYAVGLLWKRPILRDYIFYELHPGVHFHEQFDYQADYRFQVTLELFIGE